MLDGADTVELKLTVPLADGDRAATGAFDPLGAQIRQVYFFDTRDLALSKHRVVVRARRIQRKEHDSVVKLRPVVPSALPRALHNSRNFGVEVDATPEGYVCSGSMKHTLGAMDVREAVGGMKPLRKLFSKEQRELYEAHAPQGLSLDDLSILGPIFVLKLKFVPEGYARKVVAELWLYPDSSTVLELSIKCAPTEALRVAAATGSCCCATASMSPARNSRRRRRRSVLFEPTRRRRKRPRRTKALGYFGRSPGVAAFDGFHPRRS